MKTHTPNGSRTLCGLKLRARSTPPSTWSPRCVDVLAAEAPTCKTCHVLHVLHKPEPVVRKNYSGQHATARRTVNIPEAAAARIEAKARARKMTLVAFIIAAAEAFAGCVAPVEHESVDQQTEAPELIQAATTCDGNGQCVTCDGKPSSRRLTSVPSGLWNPSTDRWTLVDRDGAAFSWCRR